MKHIFAFLLVLTLLAIPAQAVGVDADQVYCFSPEDFAQEGELVGICITGLPESRTGTVMLGSRVLQPGDILTAQQVSQMTFCPVRSEQDSAAEVTYLPIFQGRVAPAATMSIAIRGKEDKEPVAQDHTQETYKNLQLEGVLKAHDPEGEALRYTVLRQPRRGTVELREDGSFLYTPKKNKVGVDSFTYTATDPAGKVSREATVTIRILKPTDDKRYADTAQFEAQWLRNTGIFQGEMVGNQLCFQPEKAVSRGEFLAMVTKLLVSDDVGAETLNENIPAWLQPYYAAALRAGFMTNFPTEEMDAPITPQEAAVLLQNALELNGEAPEAEAEEALAVMNRHDLLLCDGETLTRAQVAELLYQVSHLAQ